MRKMEHFAAFILTLLFLLPWSALSQSDGNPNVSDDKNIFLVHVLRFNMFHHLLGQLVTTVATLVITN